MKNDWAFMESWWQAILNEMPIETRRQVALYVACQPFSPGETLPVPRQHWLASQDCWLLFADLAPHANWGHPCRYFILDKHNGQVLETRDAEFPPRGDLLHALYRGEAVQPWMLLAT